jgi:rare lipoprotein A
MKKQILGGLSVTLLMSAMSALPSQAQSVNVASAESTSIPLSVVPSGTTLSPSTADHVTYSAPADLSESGISSEGTNTRTQSLSSSSSEFLVNAHALNNRQAATIYVSNIPVLTFIGDELSDLSHTHQANLVALAQDTPDTLNLGMTGTPLGLAPTLSSPESRAQSTVQLLEQLTASGLDSAIITARWDAAREQYVIMAGEQELIALSDTVRLPDSTGNVAEDTLQVANRLRRLLGGFEPITEIQGRPEPVRPAPEVLAVRSTSSGLASWYGPGFHGRRSASGEVFNQNAMTAAHRTLPFGTQVRVTNLSNGEQVTVRINDRGPFSGGRVIDLSAGAAREIGLTNAGVGQVRLEVLGN